MKSRVTALFLLIVVLGGTLFSGCTKKGDEIDVEGLIKELSGNVEEQMLDFAELQKFKAKTIDGDSFSQKQFKKKDITMLNFWSVACLACIKEWPYLSEFASTCPDNIQVITVCIDGEAQKAQAQKVLGKMGFGGITLISGDEAFEQILSKIQYTPTALFVDSKGVLLSDAVVGGFETKEEFDRFYKKRLNELLVGLGKEKAFEEPQD